MNPQMNAPDRNEKFMVPEGMKKVSYEKDANVENAAKITLQREDHTVGNLIRAQLHRDKDVLFAGYKVPHPQSYKVEMKIQTKSQSSPMQAYNLAIYDLNKELDKFRSFFGPSTESEESSKIEESGFGEMITEIVADDDEWA